MTKTLDIIKMVWIFLILAIGSISDIRYNNVTFRYLILSASGCIALSVPCFDTLNFFTGLLPGLFLLLFARISSGAIGDADAYAVCFIGVLLGLYTAVTILMIALLVICIYAQILIITKKAGRRSRLPLYPYLTAAFLLRLMILKGGN